MSELTNTTETKIAAAFAGGSAYQLSTWYAALHTASPGETGSGTEVTTSGYARQAITTWSGSADAKANGSALVFGPFSADPPEIGFGGVWTHATSGYCVCYSAVGAARDADNGDSITVAAGAITVTFA